MARVEDLIAAVENPAIARELAAEVAALKRRLRFGLVFESHLPETALLLNAQVKEGSVVARRRDARNKPYGVVAVRGDDLVIRALDGDPVPMRRLVFHPTAEEETVRREETVVLARFGDPIHPALTPLGEVRCGPDDRRSHAVIEGENFHALQLLTFTHPGSVDCVYLDPPYNTGAKDWKYNNRYVDKTDSYRHSRWLSFIEKRLRLAKRLLKPDGVLVVSIDENEHAHLGLLLEQLFPGCEVTSVAIVHNPRGIQGDNFSYVNDFAVFVVPSKGRIMARPKQGEEIDAEPLRNWGGESLRTDARGCFYPVYVRDDAIVGFGEVPPDDFHPGAANEPQPDGTTAVWPLGPRDGVEHKWRYARQSVEAILPILSVKRPRGRRAGAELDIYMSKEVETFRSIWGDSRYDANTHGSQLLGAFGVSFPFPKSLYTMYDILLAAVGNRPNAVIIDAFAGSGTTLHATWLLNATIGGNRTCLLVTNNEVEAGEMGRLNRAGHFRGDPEYEARGIFQSVTRPRTEAALTGHQGGEGGPEVEGAYLTGRPFAQGFEENVAFYRLDYLDALEVDLGLRLAELLPALWLGEGGIGELGEVDADAAFAVLPDTNVALLFRAAGLRRLLGAVAERPDIRRIYVVTDSEPAFAELASQLPPHLSAVMLYRDYLAAGRGNR